MTLDPVLRGIFSAADDTIEQLERLHAASQARRTDYLGQLRAVVAGLDRGSPEEPPEVGPDAGPERRRRNEERRSSGLEGEPFVALPQRTTRGGDYGPAIRGKLIREALAKSDW